MSAPVVVFDSVWKKFRRGERHDSLRDLIPAAFRRLLKPSRQEEKELREREFCSIKDVSFEVLPGEALGIIGPNGAGKSTTLKLLTRILKPTIGECRVTGRVGALIEVASGFHPDLTGRENVFLQGAIMGMSQVDIRSRFDEIVAFSGVEAFIDTPIKRYSSGMQARLGFSIAAHMDPDVLFVDEVLSVGDVSFQARCLEKMHQHVRRGTTLVFVSHNLQAVANLCKRCLVIGGGQKLHDGATEQGLTTYLEAGQTQSTLHGVHDQALRVRSVRFRGEQNGTSGRIVPHERCQMTVVIECIRDTAPLNAGLELERTRDLFYAFGASSQELGLPLRAYRAGEVAQLDVGFVAHLARGHYRINFNLRDPVAGKFLCVAENLANFTVDEHVTYDGVCDIELEMEFQEVSHDVIDKHLPLSV